VVTISGLIPSNQRKSQTGQAQILAATLFLLLIPTTIIVAQNATENITGNLSANLSMEDAASGAPAINETNKTDRLETGAPPLNDTNITDPQGNATENITIPEENATINITPPSNETNITVPDNQTEPPEEEAEPLGPVEVSLKVPERANRNEPFLLSAEITNTGDTDATDVEVEWVLPDGFSILSGSGSHYCDVPSNAACISEIEAAASLSSILGEQEIKVLVRYSE
jgi:hypothetical protein